MTLEEYVKLIMKEYSYLFSRYRFKVVHKEEYRPGYFSIGLESDVCRILFAGEQGGGVMYLGTIDAPFRYEDHPKWVLVLNLLSYLLQKEWDWSFLKEKSPSERTAAWESFMAKEFEPVSAQILDMFRSPEVVAHWRPVYEEYEEGRAQQQRSSR